MKTVDSFDASTICAERLNACVFYGRAERSSAGLKSWFFEAELRSAPLYRLVLCCAKRPATIWMRTVDSFGASTICAERLNACVFYGRAERSTAGLKSWFFEAELRSALAACSLLGDASSDDMDEDG
jgi:hypothetical protein